MCKQHGADVILVNRVFFQLLQIELEEGRGKDYWQTMVEATTLHELVHRQLFLAGDEKWSNHLLGNHVLGSAQFEFDAYDRRMKVEGDEQRRWEVQAGGADPEPEKPRGPSVPAKSAEPLAPRYTVTEGDSLWRLAKAIYGRHRYWTFLYEKNQKTVTHAKKWLFPGQPLLIYPPPDKEGEAYRKWLQWMKRKAPHSKLPGR
jgi:hypothetical protein